MKVYVAQRNYCHEGSEIIGIFTTEKAAKECCANDYYDGNYYGDSHDVDEYELQD